VAGCLDIQVEEYVVAEGWSEKLQLTKVAVALSGEILGDLGRQLKGARRVDSINLNREVVGLMHC